MTKYTAKIRSNNSFIEQGGRRVLASADNLCDPVLSSNFLNNYLNFYFRIIYPYT